VGQLVGGQSRTKTYEAHCDSSADHVRPTWHGKRRRRRTATSITLSHADFLAHDEARQAPEPVC